MLTHPNRSNLRESIAHFFRLVGVACLLRLLGSWESRQLLLEPAVGATLKKQPGLITQKEFSGKFWQLTESTATAFVIV